MDSVLVAVISGAALIVGAWIGRPARKHGRVLEEINKAVNRVPAVDGEKGPPLWQRIDDTREAIGEVKGMLGAHLTDPAAHWDGSAGSTTSEP